MKNTLAADYSRVPETGTWCLKRFYVFLNMLALFVAVAFAAGGGNSPIYSAGFFVYIKAGLFLLPILSALMLFLTRPTVTFQTIKKITAENKYFIFYLIAAFFSIPLAVDWAYSLNRLAYTGFGTLSVLSVALQYGVLFNRDIRIAVLKKHLTLIGFLALALFAAALFYQRPDNLVPGVRNAISAYRVIHPNLLAAFFAHLVVWQLCWFYFSQQKNLFSGTLSIGLFIAILLLFSRSVFAAAFLSFGFVAVLTYLWYRKSTPLLIILSALCVACYLVVASMVGGFLTPESVLGIFARGMNIDSLYTLTNRTELWRILFEDVGVKQFFLGHGYSVINPDFSVDFGTGILYGAHNAYLAVFLGCGIFALAFYLLFLISGLVGIMRVRHTMPAALVLALIGSYSLLAINSFLSEEVGVNTSLTFAYVLLIKTLSGLYYSERKANQ